MQRAELIAKLEAATAGSRELDFWVWWYGKSTEACKADAGPPDADYVGANIHLDDAPRYTTSFDVAMTLATKWNWLVGRGRTRSEEPLYGAQIFIGEQLVAEAESKASPEIALCIACIKAVAS